ncbi:MAG: hypothetical protein O2807_10835 [bacterium]|nr:hypothetical protein [bacterium]
MKRLLFHFALLAGLAACAPVDFAPGIETPAARPASETALLRRQVAEAQERGARQEVALSQFTSQIQRLAS